MRRRTFKAYDDIFILYSNFSYSVIEKLQIIEVNYALIGGRTLLIATFLHYYFFRKIE
jgi:hypothetical protein